MPGGESARVAARVRELLGDPGADDPVDETESPRRPPWWLRLARRVPVRLDPGRRAALALGGAVLVAALATGLWLLANRPRALSVARTPAPITGAASPVGTARPPGSVPAVVAGPATASGPATPAGPEGEVVVDVAGKVRRPGLYRLPAGSRVDDAVRAAGGARPGVDLDNLNLAAKVSDGQQIMVGLPSLPGATAGAPAAGAGPAPATGPVSLNNATAEQLDALPGVGPVLAQHIVDYRTAHGGFSSVSQLQEVSGIGPAKYDTIKNLVTL